MSYRNCCCTRAAKRIKILSKAARSALAEQLESRLHLSYDNRGTISVIVDGTVASDITAELAQYEQDLIGDGWRIAPDSADPNIISHLAAPRMDDEHEVWTNFPDPLDPLFPNPHAVESTTSQYRSDLADVKSLITADRDAAIAAGSQLKAVVIIGHVTVPYSGLPNYDSHDTRAMPTDQYYADLDASLATWGDMAANFIPPGLWASKDYELTPNIPGDGRFDASVAPSVIDEQPVVPIDLAFGRIDMANLGLAFASSETDLLKAYFARDHNYRTTRFRPTDRALVQSDPGGGAVAYPDYVDTLGTSEVDNGYWLDAFGRIRRPTISLRRGPVTARLKVW